MNDNVQTAHELYTILETKSETVNRKLIEMGRILKELKDGDKYLEATGGIESWQQFLKQPEVGLSVSEAEALISIYTIFVEDFGYSIDDLSGINIKNLKTLVKLSQEFDLRNATPNIMELMDQARVLSDRDFREALAERDETLSETSRTYSYVVMQRCNETKTIRKVHGISSEQITNTFNINELTRNVDV